MTQKEFNELERGDIVRHVNHPESYVIDHTAVTDGRKFHIAVRIETVTNPDEWEKFEK